MASLRDGSRLARRERARARKPVPRTLQALNGTGSRAARSGDLLLKFGLAFSSSSVATSRLLLSRGAALTTNNVKKALYFEERARKAKDLMRRERFHRAAYRYRLAAAREREAAPTDAAAELLPRRSGLRLTGGSSQSLTELGLPTGRPSPAGGHRDGTQGHRRQTHNFNAGPSRWVLKWACQPSASTEVVTHFAMRPASPAG